MPPTISRAEAMLAEAASQALTLARDLQGQALDAETADEKVKLTGAWAMATRSMRQSLALQARLGRELRRDDREERLQVAREHAEQLPRRAEEVREAGRAMIWTECEAPDDREALDEALYDYITDAGCDPAFTQRPLGEVLAEVREKLGLDEAGLRDALAERVPATEPDSPSPPVGEGGLRGRPDEGSLKPLGANGASARNGQGSATPHPSPSATPSPTRGEGRPRDDGKRRRRSG